MHTKPKTNLKLFIPLSILCTAISALFLSKTSHFIGLTVVYAGGLTSLWMLREIVYSMIAGQEGEKEKKSNLFIMSLGKISILICSLLIGVHFMEKKIIIPLLNYIVHIFIFVLSLKQKREDT